VLQPLQSALNQLALLLLLLYCRLLTLGDRGSSGSDSCGRTSRRGLTGSSRELPTKQGSYEPHFAAAAAATSWFGKFRLVLIVMFQAVKDASGVTKHPPEHRQRQQCQQCQQQQQPGSSSSSSQAAAMEKPRQHSPGHAAAVIPARLAAAAAAALAALMPQILSPALAA
jgi:hypothetical protein